MTHDKYSLGPSIQPIGTYVHLFDLSVNIRLVYQFDQSVLNSQPSTGHNGGAARTARAGPPPHDVTGDKFPVGPSIRPICTCVHLFDQSVNTRLVHLFDRSVLNPQPSTGDNGGAARAARAGPPPHNITHRSSFRGGKS